MDYNKILYNHKQLYNNQHWLVNSKLDNKFSLDNPKFHKQQNKVK